MTNLEEFREMAPPLANALTFPMARRTLTFAPTALCPPTGSPLAYSVKARPPVSATSDELLHGLTATPTFAEQNPMVVKTGTNQAYASGGGLSSKFSSNLSAGIEKTKVKIRLQI